MYAMKPYTTTSRWNGWR